MLSLHGQRPQMDILNSQQKTDTHNSCTLKYMYNEHIKSQNGSDIGQ